MTDDLTILMHDRADGRDFAVPDLDTIVADGDRRVRRRRLGVTAGVAAMALAGAGVVVAVTGGDGVGRDDPPVAEAPEVAPADPIDTDVVSWALGSVIHTPDTTIDVGHEVETYVRTSVGYVVSDPEGVVYAVDASGTQEVGTVSDGDQRLRSDPHGSLAGWVDATGERPAFVVLDQATGHVVRDDSHTRPGMGLLADEADPAYFYAIDGMTAYWRDQRGAVAVDVPSGDVRVVDAEARNGFDVIAAGGRRIAFITDDGWGIGQRRDSVVLLDGVTGDSAVFSPDGRHLAVIGDGLLVLDSGTGSPVALDLRSRASTAYEWLDADTVVVLDGAATGAQLEVLTCSVSSGDCKETGADLGTIGEVLATGALPGSEASDG